MSNLADELTELITNEVSKVGEPIDASTDLLLSGIVDSLGVVRIVHWLEERCGFEIDAADVTLDNFQTVAATVAYVDRRQGATP